jgi:hypothetical protein
VRSYLIDDRRPLPVLLFIFLGRLQQWPLQFYAADLLPLSMRRRGSGSAQAILSR